MAEDYAAAATRHFNDATLLEKNSRLANADHLLGFAAECAIKSALVEHPRLLTDGKLTSAYHKHVNQLWGPAQVTGVQKRYPKLLAVLKGQQAFHDWTADQRYEPDGLVTPDILDRHRRAAARILGSVGLSGTRAAK